MKSTGTVRTCLLTVLIGTALIGSPLRGAASDTAPGDSFYRDRRAILDLAGRYHVSFRFRETIPLREGYRPRKPFTAGGTEVIKVIEDEGDRISLQHFLIVNEGSTVIKHWRQVWTYEDRLVYEYRGNRTWRPQLLPAKKVNNTWSWAVFQVGDSPRYETYGSFTHRPGVSTWESRRFWRPLPRRETKKRDDYDVLDGRHRLTITEDAWYHEQDNAKIKLNDRGTPESVLVREVGLNTYTRARNVDVSPVEEYRASHREFWEEVRSYWKRVMGLRRPIRLRSEIKGDPLWKTLFQLAEQTGQNISNKEVEKIHRSIDRYRIHPNGGT